MGGVGGRVVGPVGADDSLPQELAQIRNVKILVRNLVTGWHTTVPRCLSRAWLRIDTEAFLHDLLRSRIPG